MVNNNVIICKECETRNQHNGDKCINCNHALTVSKNPIVYDNRWVRKEGDICVSITEEDFGFWFRKEIIIEPGTQVMITLGGKTLDMFPPGTYPLGSIIRRSVRDKAKAYLIRTTPFNLSFKFDKLYTKDNHELCGEIRLNMKVEKPAKVAIDLMGKDRRYTEKQLSELLERLVAEALDNWFSEHTENDVSALSKVDDYNGFAMFVEKAIEETLETNGIRYCDIHDLVVENKGLAERKEILSEHTREANKIGAIAEGSKKVIEAKISRDEVDLQELERETDKLNKKDAIEHRARMQKAERENEEILSEIEAGTKAIKIMKSLEKNRNECSNCGQGNGSEFEICKYCGELLG